jgi:hypothetical protein
MRPAATYIHPKAGAHQVKHILVRQRMRHEQKSWHPEKTRVSMRDRLAGIRDENLTGMAVSSLAGG